MNNYYYLGYNFIITFADLLSISYWEFITLLSTFKITTNIAIIILVIVNTVTKLKCHIQMAK